MPRFLRSKVTSRRVRLALLIFILTLGLAMRLFKFPSVPIGLHQDEIMESYESYSLLTTGADRWGYRLPAYFLSWGSGQNVLQSYLTIPVVAVTGLTRLSTRFVPMFFGLLMLPLFCLTVKRWHGEVAALLSLLFLSLSPWHVMLSRLGVENSELPFFMTLGLFTYGASLRSKSRLLLFASLLPFALSLYCYGTVVVVLPGLLLLLLLEELYPILERRNEWLGAIAVFLLAASPIGLFLVKNYITKRDYAFEKLLPISVPLLPITRLSQIQAETPGGGVLRHNLHFLRHGFLDNISWFQAPGFRPLPLCVLGLAVLGLVSLLYQGIKRRKFDDPFSAWLVATVPLFFLFPLNTSRANAIFAPILALAGVGGAILISKGSLRSLRIGSLCFFILLFMFDSLKFVHAYFGSTYATAVAPTLYPDLPTALDAAIRRGGGVKPIYVSEQISLNYIQVLFYTKVPPLEFQHSGATFNHPDFGVYRFSRESIERVRSPFIYLLAEGESPLCPPSKDRTQIGYFTVGECRESQAK
jgi:hypothetical protein